MQLKALFMSLLVVAASLAIHASGLSQTITLSGKDISLKQVFAEIEKQTGYLVVWNNDQLGRSKPVTIDARKQPLDPFIKQVLKEQPLGYTIENQTIFIRFKQAIPEKKQAVADIVSGVVKDNAGQPLAGATVTVKGTGVSVATNADGYFSLDVKKGQTLVISFVGYQTKQVTIGDHTQIHVALEPATNSLDEMVIIGYGSTVRRSNTGTVATVKNKEIMQQPVADPLAALQGRMAGVVVNATNGFRGSAFNVMIRGRNFINEGGNQPLYVIDGVPFFAEPIDQFTSAGGMQSPLATINPADIERIDVLKDADATAIYGSRAANGVILITTRKGKAGKTQIDFNGYTGVSKVVNTVDMLSTPEYLQLRKEAFTNDNVVQTDDNAPDLRLWNQQKTTNWQDYLIGNTANLTQLHGSISGGNEQTRFMFSGTYRRETTVLPNELPFTRGASHLNLDHTSVNKKFNVTASVTYSGAIDKSLSADITSFYNIAPNYPIYDSAGDYYWFSNEQNPGAYLLRRSSVKTKTLVANSVLRYTIFPGLDVKTSLGYTQTNMEQLQVYPNATFNPRSSTGSFSYFGNSDVNNYIIEPQLTYTRPISEGILQVLAGGTWQSNTLQGKSFHAENFSSDALLENISSAAKVTARPSVYRQYNYNSFFGRLNYNWNDKYIVNGSFRRDGSTRFGPGYRFGNFGAIGAAWVFSKEQFFPETRVISFGKLRASYGVTGNDRISDYEYLPSWSSVSLPYDGIPGLAPSRLANASFRWETNRKLEAALELGLFKDRILLTTNFYRNISDNQLVEYALTPQVGFTEIRANFPATVLNTGWEFELTSVNIRNRGLTWRTNFNLSINKNELKSFPGLEASTYKDRYVEGQSLTIVKGYQFNGIDAQTGLPTFQNFDADPAISENVDYVVLGQTLPEFYGGLGNTIGYKGFELDFLFQFVKQEGPGINYGYLANQPGYMRNYPVEANERWIKAGDNASLPRASTTATAVKFDQLRLSSAMWEDASFIRLKNVSLRYDLSKHVKRYTLNNLVVYVLGQNLLTITDYKGFDPETRGLFMPPMKTVTAGLQFTF